MAYGSLSLTPGDFRDRYNELKRSGWSEIHNSILRSRMIILGDILPQAVKAQLDKDDKPALAYNFPRVYLRNASGAQRQARVDERVYPLQDGSKEVAGALSRWLKWHSTRNHLQSSYATLYEDMWIGGFGVIENARVVIDDPFGTNQSVAGNPLQHMFDLSVLRPDGKDMADQMKESYLCAQDLQRILGITLEDAKKLARSNQIGDRGSVGTHQSIFSASRIPLDDPLRFRHPSLGHGITQSDRVPVLEWWFTRYEPRIFIYDVMQATPMDVSDRSEGEIAEIMKALEAQGTPAMVVQASTRRLYHAMSLENDILVQAEPFGPQTFPNVYGLGYKIGSMISGEVESLVDPTVAFSKAMSAITEVVAKTPNTGIITTSDQDIDVEQRTQLEMIANGRAGTANIPGMVQQPTLVQHNQYPAGLFNYAQMHENMMKELAGSPDNLRGIGSGSHQSGVHAMAMIQQGMQSSEVIRDNYMLARRLNAETNIKFLQYYEGPIPFRMLKVLRDDDTPEEIQMNQMLGDRILNDLSVGEYLVTVEQTAYTVTDRQQKAKATLEAFAAAGVPVPPQLILEMSDDPEAEKHFAMLQDWQRQQMEQELLNIVKTGKA